MSSACGAVLTSDGPHDAEAIRRSLLCREVAGVILFLAIPKVYLNNLGSSAFLDYSRSYCDLASLHRWSATTGIGAGAIGRVHAGSASDRVSGRARATAPIAGLC
jgi:hypothetical protein